MIETETELSIMLLWERSHPEFYTDPGRAVTVRNDDMDIAKYQIEHDNAWDSI